MSKKLIVVTRVLGSDEFSGVFGLKDSPFKTLSGRMIVINGNGLLENEEGKPFEKTIVNIVNRISELVIENNLTADECFVLYHAGGNQFSCYTQIKDVPGITNAREYSSEGDTMKWIQTELKEVLSPGGTEDDLDTLLFRCFGDGKRNAFKALLEHQDCIDYKPNRKLLVCTQAEKHFDEDDWDVWREFMDSPGSETYRALRNQLLGD
jgi:hypothetical protein